MDWRFADCGRRFRPCVHTVSIALLAVNRTFRSASRERVTAPPLSRYARPYPHPQGFRPCPVLDADFDGTWGLAPNPPFPPPTSLHRKKKTDRFWSLIVSYFSLAAIVGLT